MNWLDDYPPKTHGEEANLPASHAEELPGSAELIDRRIYIVRGRKVMLDADLAELNQVETRVLNQAVRRNLDRFPEDFMFQLTAQEASALGSQIVTLEQGRGCYSKDELAATEHEHAIALVGVVKEIRHPKAPRRRKLRIGFYTDEK